MQCCRPGFPGREIPGNSRIFGHPVSREKRAGIPGNLAPVIGSFQPAKCPKNSLLHRYFFVRKKYAFTIYWNNGICLPAKGQNFFEKIFGFFIGSVHCKYFTESLDGVSLSKPQLPYPECHFYEPILWFAIKAWTSLKKSANLGHSNFPGNSRESLRIPGKFPFPGNPKIRENRHHQLQYRLLI